MLTDRDKKVIEFVEKFGIASTTQIESLFFPRGSACRRRLGILRDKYKLIKSRRTTMGAENMWYKGKPLRYPEHRLRLVDLYINLSKFEIRTFQVEPQYGDIVPDAYTEIAVGSSLYLFFVEVHMGYQYQKFDQQKYERLYQMWRGQTFPRVVILTDRAIKLDPSQIRYIIPDKVSEIFKEE